MASSPFYATRGDLLALFSAVETMGSLKYLQTGNFSAEGYAGERAAQQLNSGADIVGLGVAGSHSSAGCSQYLVVESSEPIELRRIVAKDGQARILVDQLLNPNSIVVNVGGMYRENVFIEGLVSTTGVTPQAKRLFERWRRQLKRVWVKVGPYFLGPNICQLDVANVRFTVDAMNPRGLDNRFSSSEIQATRLKAGQSVN